MKVFSNNVFGHDLNAIKQHGAERVEKFFF